MSSQSNTTSPSDLPRYSTTAPPPYSSSDANSLVSTKSTSKSILAKLLNRKPAEATSQSSNEAQKKVDESENRAAARAAYFSGL
ncbi:uncharacterized protein J4E79_006296 [Alternaria viburni]|uniref:uncharacterized protein n=1 Tax=Alternaria viburni TaxID=566460 RepID=UPI0020C2AEB1|nr:uncharacterized protein J4E79_006296 [Alternaria viburni]KAI4659760.1 hypothetical protein J4E79_006296 [Alternaria viburni]